MSSYGLWLSAAGMKVNEHRQAVLANNMANAHTTGFKQDLAVIRERVVESRENGYLFEFRHPVLDNLAGGVDVRQSYHDFSQGAIEHTSKPLDVAIVGEGLFVVSDGSNERYTRNGEFALNTEGELVLSSGDGRWRVLDSGNNVIRIDPALGAAEVASDGTIRQGEEVIARLLLVTVDDKQALHKRGENLFELTAGEPTAVDGKIEVGALESSNFNVMTGLASMIEATRVYEMNANLLRMQDEMTGRVVSTVGRLS